ncbi:MAG: M23 family metallopeptidase [Alphaproteobacteria bacterium]|nr:M23 family metallopeptidase [Alphaproteobacteria bacterium]
MKWYRAIFFTAICLVFENAWGNSFLQAQNFPGTFQDLDFASRLDVLAQGYEDVGVEYDENGKCISGCAYKGITLAEEEQLIYQASAELQQVIEQEQVQVTAGQLKPVPTENDIAVKPEIEPFVPQEIPSGNRVNKFFRPPVGGSVKVASDFGERRPPKTSNGTGAKYHRGIDIKASTGTPLYAAADGVVIEAGKNGGYGNVVKIQHPFSTTDKTAVTVYAHLSQIDVKNGQRVVQGQQIGKAGNTGNSSSAHLHYELRFNNVKVDPLGAYVAPILNSDTAVATSTRGTNYLGADYCFKPGISSTRLQPFVGDSQGLQQNFPGCMGWCSSY